jgi:hypothetical protein
MKQVREPIMPFDPGTGKWKPDALRKKELVHGLTETVDLKDWDFAIIQAALKLYIKDAKQKGKSPAVVGYAQQLQKKLKRPFVKLVKRTKREHRRLENLLTHEKDLSHFIDREKRLAST